MSNSAPSELLDSLRTRRRELEQAILARAYGIADPTGSTEQRYVDGLRRAVSAAFGYGLAAIERGQSRRIPPVPAELLVQARLAARNDVSLDTVLRRYCGGNTVFADAVIDVAERLEVDRTDLKRILRLLSSSFDRLIAVVSEEYAREERAAPETGEQRRANLVQRLLAGELLDAADLAYDLDGWHLGLIVAGPVPAEALRELATAVDRRPLFVSHEKEVTWAWLGGLHAFDPGQVTDLSAFSWPPDTRVAVGEPAKGLSGWRLTHRQAAATLPIALRGEHRIAHYGRAPLLASALKDELLATSLRRLFLEPLQDDRDGGEEMRRTLRAYFAAGGNISSAAAAIGVSRNTVASRLATVEDRLGQPVETVSAEIETALCLDEIEGA